MLVSTIIGRNVTGLLKIHQVTQKFDLDFMILWGSTYVNTTPVLLGSHLSPTCAKSLGRLGEG